MKFKYNDSTRKLIRRILRVNQTEVERLLWNRIRNRRLIGARFIRQYSIGRYVLDFYCPEKRLAIELDGSQHLEQNQVEYDKERTEYLRSLNIQVIRFWNNQIFNEMNNVLEAITNELTHP
ncbi:MAG: endonuclease domain-containing protein [Patescibacteria group bacterium]|nr:endonuclease domain-containing protein [Patescibacteria group bacterium]